MENPAIYPPSETQTPFMSWLREPIRVNWETLFYALMLCAALFTRFHILGARVMSHDESLHTYYSYVFFERGEFRSYAADAWAASLRSQCALLRPFRCQRLHSADLPGSARCPTRHVAAAIPPLDRSACRVCGFFTSPHIANNDVLQPLHPTRHAGTLLRAAVALVSHDVPGGTILAARTLALALCNRLELAALLRLERKHFHLRRHLRLIPDPILALARRGALSQHPRPALLPFAHLRDPHRRVRGHHDDRDPGNRHSMGTILSAAASTLSRTV